MKKVLLAIAAVATITSCSQNEEFENPAQNAEINFSTIVSKSTRAVIIENKDFKKFTAYGYSHGETNFTGVVTSTIMSSAEYTKGEDGGWTTSGRYYWPTSGKVTFFGYGGVATATYAKEDGKFPTLKYTVLTDVNKQEDLLVAQQANKSKENNNPSVNLNFKHALAQVYFKLKGNDADLTYTVSKIELNKVRTEGTLTYGGDPDTSIGQWAVEDNASTGNYAITLNDQKVIGEAEATILNDALTQVMILMPQSLAGVEVKVTYSAEKGGLEVHSASEPVTVKLTGNWEAGSKTAYVLSLNGDAINLTGSSDDTSWSEKTDVNTDVNK